MVDSSNSTPTLPPFAWPIGKEVIVTRSLFCNAGHPNQLSFNVPEPTMGAFAFTMKILPSDDPRAHCELQLSKTYGYFLNVQKMGYVYIDVKDFGWVYSTVKIGKEDGRFLGVKNVKEGLEAFKRNPFPTEQPNLVDFMDKTTVEMQSEVFWKPWGGVFNNHDRHAKEKVEIEKKVHRGEECVCVKKKVKLTGKEYVEKLKETDPGKEGESMFHSLSKLLSPEMVPDTNEEFTSILDPKDGRILSNAFVSVTNISKNIGIETARGVVAYVDEFHWPDTAPSTKHRIPQNLPLGLEVEWQDFLQRLYLSITPRKALRLEIAPVLRKYRVHPLKVGNIFGADTQEMEGVLDETFFTMENEEYWKLYDEVFDDSSSESD